MRTVQRSFPSGGYDVVVDAVVGPWLLGPFQRRAGLAAPLLYVVLRPAEETALSRAVERGAPALTERGPLQHMYAEFAGLGDHEKFVLDNTAWSATETADRILELIETRDNSVATA